MYLGSTPEDEAPEVTSMDTFMVPKKEISMVPDMGKWKRSQVGSCLWLCEHVLKSVLCLTFHVMYKKYQTLTGTSTPLLNQHLIPYTVLTD